MYKLRHSIAVTVGVVTLLLLPPAFAETRILVPDFELNDLTLIPRTRKELERTASIAPMLREALQKEGYTVLSVTPAELAAANVAFGYLFEHPDVAAELGAKHGAHYVAVGRLHKPSYLFAYLKIHLMDVAKQRQLADFNIEVKGDLPKMNKRGAETLATQIAEALQ